VLVAVGGTAALVSFSGDFLLLVYLLGWARRFTVLAALDNGHAFEGMGASREVRLAPWPSPALPARHRDRGRAVVRPEQAGSAIMRSRTGKRRALDVWGRPTGCSC